MLFLKVPKDQGEKIRQQLIAEGIFDPDYNIFSEGGFLFFPVRGSYAGFETVEREAGKRETGPYSLREALEGILSEEELQSLITAFDVIGDIAILEIPDELEGKEQEIAHALLKVHPNIKSVFKKLGAMEGEFRIRRLRHLAGENRTEAVYREHGCQFKLDVSKVYFSVRLSHERGRIADLVKENGKILVMFAGVGPFAIVIAKKHPDAKITAVELNPDAVEYMRENAALNKCGNIEVIEGDAAAFEGKDFDRVIMPLPKSAHEFLSTAVKAAKEGGTIHFYSIVSIKDPFDEGLKKARDAVPEAKLEMQSARIVKPYSADLVQVVLDLVKPV